jgi:hypothetical protein
VLNPDDLFADHFEPEAIYHVKLGGKYPKGSLLEYSEAKLKAIGVAPSDPQLLVEARDLTGSMDNVREKAGDLAPTLVLIEMKNGTVCGGVAGVPWPKRGERAVDPARGSFIFSLGAASTRFDLIRPEQALYSDISGFCFGASGHDLYLMPPGLGCGSGGEGDYAGPREAGQLFGGCEQSTFQPVVRWELWRL